MDYVHSTVFHSKVTVVENSKMWIGARERLFHRSMYMKENQLQSMFEK